MTPQKIALVFGTRPEAVKLAPLYQELRRREGKLQVEVIVTAQHRQMLDQMLHAFGITPNVDLDVMQPEQTLSDLTARSLTLLQSALARRAPDMVLVQGDTTTAFTAALAAYYEKIAVGHVEAGLRTENKYSPFPEEMNRRLVGVLADVHFAATSRARHNLLGEGIEAARIYLTGNPVVDALYAVLERGDGLRGTPLEWVDELEGRICLMTAHRRENLGVPLTRIFLAIRELIQRFSDLHVIFPVHLNPKVRKAADEVLGGVQRVHLCEPVDYLTFVPLMARADVILTDSGGLQEEAPALGVPVFVTRDTTERPEGVAAGVARLVGTETERIVAEVSELLNNPAEYRRMASLGCPYGDGKAASRICDAIEHFLGLRPDRPADFAWKPGEGAKA